MHQGNWDIKFLFAGTPKKIPPVLRNPHLPVHTSQWESSCWSNLIALKLRGLHHKSPIGTFDVQGLVVLRDALVKIACRNLNLPKFMDIGSGIIAE